MRAPSHRSIKVPDWGDRRRLAPVVPATDGRDHCGPARGWDGARTGRGAWGSYASSLQEAALIGNQPWIIQPWRTSRSPEARPETFRGLEPLWVAVHHQHVASMPELAPFVSDEVTWRERRGLYEELFRKPDIFLYSLRSLTTRSSATRSCTSAPAAETWVTDTWVTGDRIAELESISVLPEHREKGSARCSWTSAMTRSSRSASRTSSSGSSRATRAHVACTNGMDTGRRGTTSAASAVDRAFRARRLDGLQLDRMSPI